MMHGREKSDPAIGGGKPTNKAEATSVVDAAEPVEQRAGAKGNASGQSTHRIQSRERVSQALDRVRQAARLRKKEKFTASPPPHRRRPAAGCVLRAQTRCRSRRGRGHVAGLRGRP